MKYRLSDSQTQLSLWGDIGWTENSTAGDQFPIGFLTEERPQHVHLFLYTLGLESSSTALYERPAEIDEQLQALFAAAREEIFEDGMESEFSRGLLALIDLHGRLVIEALTKLIFSEGVNAEVAAEALRWVGHSENPQTFHHRLQLLQRSLLQCSSARVRDAAALGLASMDDPSAIPTLERAIEKEVIPELREDLRLVLAQLRETASERTP